MVCPETNYKWIRLYRSPVFTSRDVNPPYLGVGQYFGQYSQCCPKYRRLEGVSSEYEYSIADTYSPDTYLTRQNRNTTLPGPHRQRRRCRLFFTQCSSKYFSSMTYQFVSFVYVSRLFYLVIAFSLRSLQSGKTTLFPTR